MRVGLLGAWSIDNTGDVVLGWAAQQAVGRRLPGATITLVAPRLPGRFWRHDFHGRGAGPIRAIAASASPEWARQFDAVVIGGGGLIGFDPAFQAFQLTRPSEWPARVPVAWNAVGSQNTAWYTASAAARQRLKSCCRRLAYVSVRSRTTAELLARCGYSGPVAVVPDPALGMTLPGNDRSDAILQAAGATPGEPLVGVSIGRAIAEAATREFYDRLAEGIAALGLRAVVFPFGAIYGDEDHQAWIAARLPRHLLIREPLSAFDRWRLIGRLRAYVGCRFHAILAAYAQDVPFLAVDEYFSDDIASSKIRELCADNGLEAHWTCPYLPTDPAARLSRVVGHHSSFAVAIERHRARLEQHYDALVRSLVGRSPATAS